MKYSEISVYYRERFILFFMGETLAKRQKRFATKCPSLKIFEGRDEGNIVPRFVLKAGKAFTSFAAIQFGFKRNLGRFFEFFDAFLEMACVWNVKMLDLFSSNGGDPW